MYWFYSFVYMNMIYDNYLYEILVVFFFYIIFLRNLVEVKINEVGCE